MSTMFGNRGFGYQQPSLGDRLKAFGKQKPALNYILVANIGIWIMVAMANVVAWLFKSEGNNIIVQFLALPSGWHNLAVKPWTPLTYMFLHERFWHLFFNLWMLYFGGTLFVQCFSDKKLVWTYIMGGLFGALAFFLSYQFFPVFEDVKDSASLLGASASVLAILVASAAYRPDYELRLLLLGRMKFKWIAIIFVVIDILSISAENPGGHIAHVGGALYGFLYGFFMRKGFRFSFPKRKRMKYTRYKTVKDKKKRPQEPYDARRVSDEEYNQRKAEKDRDIDAILDKIAKNGYTSLTSDEKEFLFKNSK